MSVWAKQKSGFTIVELLIVVVVIAILAAITIVAYNGIQNRTKNVSTQTTLSQLQKQIETYAVRTGAYPSTGSINQVYTDTNCGLGVDSDGLQTSEWIPGLQGQMGPLPQSDFAGTGRSGIGGCFAYASDGQVYVLSAWNAKYGGGSTDAMYRRLGFRETNFFSSNAYNCNHAGNIGGFSSGVYQGVDRDYYKQSYTLSNITTCNETPPSGA